MSEALEEVCRKYLIRLRHAGGLPFRPAILGLQREKSVKIDIVAADRERRHSPAGKWKYGTEKVGMKVFRSLQAKCASLPVPDAVFHYRLFSRSGFEESVTALAERAPTSILWVWTIDSNGGCPEVGMISSDTETNISV